MLNWGKGDIGEMEFLHDFSKEVSRPIERDDRIHIEYLPTQAFTEYIRYRFQVNNGSPLDGIMFNSSTPNAGKNVVLFATKKIVLSMLNSLTSKFIHEFLNIGEMQIKITIFIKI